MTLQEIERAVRAAPGDWRAKFRRHGAGWQCIMFPERHLLETEYLILSQRLAAPGLSAAERKVNMVRHRAVSGAGS